MNDTDAARLLEREIPDSLAVHLHQIDLAQDRVLLVRLSPQDYSNASFLDHRLLDGNRPRAWSTWERVHERMQENAACVPAHYILHIGHCGSTLISRMLGELGLLPLREPLALRTFAELHADSGAGRRRWTTESFESRLNLTLRLFGRGVTPKAVKASSFCNDLAPGILASDPAVRATIVHAVPRLHIANLMAGPNSQLDLKALTPMRLQRLASRTCAPPVDPATLSPGVAAAISWATEMSALADLLDRVDVSRVQVVDFDRFLADVRGSLNRLASHAAPGLSQQRIDAVAASPTLGRYSKAPEFEYDAALRRQVLAGAEDDWGAEIRAGLRWLEQAAARHPVIARAVERFGGP